MRHYFGVLTAGSDNRCGERCIEGVDLGQLLLDGIEQNATFPLMPRDLRLGEAADNWNQFYRRSKDRSRINRRTTRTYGWRRLTEFWRAASPRPYFDRITETVMVLHGTRDDACPICWSEATVKALKLAGKASHSSNTAGRTTFELQWQRLKGRSPSSTSTSTGPVNGGHSRTSTESGHTTGSNRSSDVVHDHLPGQAIGADRHGEDPSAIESTPAE